MTRPISRVLSCAVIYLRLPSPISWSRHYFISAEPALRYKAPIDVASDRVYIAVQSPALWWALTSPFHHHPTNVRQYISVALALRSPSAAVNSYPALWCPDFPHELKTFPLPHSLLNNILPEYSNFVKSKTVRKNISGLFCNYLLLTLCFFSGWSS